MKLLHVADLHLDSPFSGLTPEQAALRRAEQRALLLRMTEECDRRGCALLLLAGDLFDGAHVYRDTLDALCQALGNCRAQVLIAPGNHDPMVDGSPYSSVQWPENVHIFRQQTIEAVEFPALGCRVYGAGFTAERCTASLLEGFRAAQDGAVNLMVLHGDPTGGTDYNPVTNAQIAASGLDYLALGHIHKRGQLRLGRTLCAWPGCAMGRGFDECGEKGALELTLDPDAAAAGGGAVTDVCFVPLGARRYEVLPVEISGDPLAAITAALPADTENDIYRILLGGECEAPDLAALHAALAPRFYALELQDRTQPPLALWQQAPEDTLKGQFLARLHAQYAAAQDDDERQTILLALRYGLALMDGREAPPL